MIKHTFLINKFRLTLAEWLLRPLVINPILSYPEELVYTQYGKAIYELSKVDKPAAKRIDLLLGVLPHFMPKGYKLELHFKKNADETTVVIYSPFRIEV